MSASITTIEELEAKLDGVLDLNDVTDCRKMIGTLLRSIRDKEQAAQRMQDQLKSLAIMVLGDKPEAHEKAREIVAGAKSSAPNLLGFLYQMAQTMADAEKMPDKQLIDEVMNTIWANYDMSSRESSILGEMIERMKRATAIKEVS